jgi:O-antigen ligase
MTSSVANLLPSSLKNRSETLAFLSLAGCISLALVSIAASEILLAAAFAGFIWISRKSGRPLFLGIRIYLPLIAFMVWNLVAALASSNKMLGLTISKKFYLFLIVLMVPLIARGENKLKWIYHAIFVAAVISSLWGLQQLLRNPDRDLLHRISGSMSQWMTYSGLLMLVLVALIAYVLCYGLRNNKWVVPVIILTVLALLFSETRNAWAGAVAGIAVLVLMRKPRAIAGFFGVILLFYFLSPASIQQRFRSGLDPSDPNTRNRIELFQTAMRLIQDHPWLGVGPKNVKYEAPRYRGSNSGEYPGWMYQHMHNNFLQVAAETGIPGLIIWLCVMAQFSWDALLVYRRANKNLVSGTEALRKEALMVSSAAIASLTALIVAGLGEYNFGDSEVLILFLFTVSAPYAFMPALHLAQKSEARSQKQEAAI